MTRLNTDEVVNNMDDDKKEEPGESVVDLQDQSLVD